MFGFLMMSSYKLIAKKHSSGNDNTITLLVCLGFILFGTTRAIIREIVVRTGFKKIFFLMGSVQLLSLVLLYSGNLVGLGVLLGIFVEGLYLNWFNLLIPRVFGFGHASKLIQSMLVVFSLWNLMVHILNYWIGM